MDQPVVASADYLPLVYGVYALASVALTVWLARTLAENGRVFLEAVFPDDVSFGDAVNRLLVVGFYLVNFGFACLHLVGGDASSPRAAIEVLATKLGSLLLVLAAMHFGNLLVFNRIRRSASRGVGMPPVAPQLRLHEAVRRASDHPAPHSPQHALQFAPPYATQFAPPALRNVAQGSEG